MLRADGHHFHCVVSFILSVMALVLRLLGLGLDNAGLVNSTGKNFRKQLYSLMQLPSAARL